MSMGRSDPVDTADAGLRDLLSAGTLHFMGIGGAGMCALAEAIVRQGGRITGCDLAPGESVKPLERLGVRVWREHDPSHVEDAVALVVSSAIPGDHPEVEAAEGAGIPVWKRAQALGEWVNEGRVVAVAGTHGKTTTTAMITEILIRSGQDPTGFVGGWVPEWGGHLRQGTDDLFVVEADEYDRSFHHLRPWVAIVTNMDADHLDIYGDFMGVKMGFRRFLEGVRDGGTVIVCADDPGAASLLPWLHGRSKSFGFSAGSQLRAVDFATEGNKSSFTVIEGGVDSGPVRLRIAGRHNALNALAAAAAARALGVEWSAIKSGLAEFVGVVRRFQLLAADNGVTVVDDYAHHPREIEAALATARAAFPESRLVAVFQPHLYTRTRDFAARFGEALADADVVWITEVYPAREPPIPGVDGALVAREVEEAVERRSHGARGVFFHRDLDSLASQLAQSLEPGDLCLTLGAGSIERVGAEVVEQLRARRMGRQDA